MFASLVRRGGKQVLRTPAVRFLNIHEYQSKELMRRHGLSVQRGGVASTPEEAATIAGDLAKGAKDGHPLTYVVKAQVHAGGRGKGVFKNGFKGGVHLTADTAEVATLAGNMLGGTIVTAQTGDAGARVDKVLVLEAVETLDRELYLAIVLDRASSAPVIIASQRGGVDIEAVAHDEPDAILKETVDLATGVTASQADGLAARLGCTGSVAEKVSREIRQLYDLFVGCDATQVEINPLAVSGSDVVCLDAKINFDDSAEPRQKEIFSWQDPAEVDPREAEAATYGLNYISLTGNIGSLVNGSGLAMSTMDVISAYGGQPANFCDLGGGANEESVTAAFRLVTSDPSVRAVLVNIFGGIVKCDVIANGVLAAIRNTDLKVPLVVRLAGTNAEQGKKILDESGVKIITAGDLDTAARLAVEAAQ